MNLEVLGEGGTGARECLMKEQRVLVDEAEGDEFGEASRFGLNFAQQEHLANPVSGSFGVAVHHGGGSADAAAVGGADHVDPLCGGELVARENGADFVVENF